MKKSFGDSSLSISARNSGMERIQNIFIMQKREKSMKKVIAALLLIAGFAMIFSAGRVGVTGDSISSGSGAISFAEIEGLIIIFVSIAIFVSRKSLDAIILPTGREDILRARKGAESKEALRPEGYYIISGVQDTQKLKDSHRYKMFRELENYGISPRQMSIEGDSKDTGENLVNSLKRIKGIYEKGSRKEGPINVGIVSYPQHLRRLMDFYEARIKDGTFGKNDFRIYKIRTEESLKNKLYEISLPQILLHNYKLNSIKRESGSHKAKGHKNVYAIINFLKKSARLY